MQSVKMLFSNSNDFILYNLYINSHFWNVIINPLLFDRFVWSIILLPEFLSDNNRFRCQSVLLNMSGLLIGGIMWPSFADSLMASHELLPGEVTLAGIIHNVQLVMSIELPILFMSIQASCFWGDGDVWKHLFICVMFTS